MRAVVLQKQNPLAWMLMPAFTARIAQFDKRYSMDGNASNIASLFEQCFASGDTRMLGIALFTQREDEGPQLHGHLVAGVDVHHGVPRCVIYQYEKDVDDAADATNDAVQAIVDAWLQVLGQREVSALATSRARAKRFEGWGYRFSSILVTRSIADGRQQERSNQFDEHADPGVATGDCQTTVAELSE